MELTALNPTVKDQLAADQLLQQHFVGQPAPLRVSIITVTYNSEPTIADALLSVMSQTHDYIEHIIIDGRSSDHTLDIVRSFPHVTKLVSETDKGVYDAMNKGLRLATGDIIGILNSDDMYASRDVISKVVELFEREKADAVYGDLLYVHHNNLDRVMRKWISGGYTKMKFKYGWMPPHPTFFVRREVYENVGLFNLSLKTAADYELMLRMLFKHDYRAAYLPEVLVKMRSGGISNGSLKKRLMANREDRKAWKLNGLHPYFFTLYLKPIRKIFQYFNKEQMRRIPILHHLI